MDQVFVELIGKPQLGAAKIITVIADNFNLLDDQARFLKATLAIPAVRQLPVDDVPKYIIQVGPIYAEIKEQIEKQKNWSIKQYDKISGNICDRIERDIELENCARSIIYINDLSRLQLSSNDSDVKSFDDRFLRLIDKWKRLDNNFVVIICQNSNSRELAALMRDLTLLSDAYIKTTSLKDHYFQHIWYQPIPAHKTLIPPKIQTAYYTCKIGKSYWSSDLLCFFDRNQVSKNYDPSQMVIRFSEEASSPSAGEDLKDNMEKLALESDDAQDDHSTTLPYIRAQNPEQSKIFYYPDKDDDIDEDDPDNDLNI